MTAAGGADMTDNPRRTVGYSTRQDNRYWWYRRHGRGYVPPVFSSLSAAEWRVIDAWHTATDGEYARECSVPLISFLHGLVMGNNIRRIVQLGHYSGYSSLLLGFMLRAMGHKHGLYSVDIDAGLSAFTARWIAKAGLSDYVKIVVADSAAKKNVAAAREYLGGRPQVAFIDSSHQYAHTVEELDLWYPALSPGGFAALHDISVFAQAGDATGRLCGGAEGGGVHRAVAEWLDRNNAAAIMINSDHRGGDGEDLVYVDGCGLGLIQKPTVAEPSAPFDKSASKSLSARAKTLSRFVNWARRLRGAMRRFS